MACGALGRRHRASIPHSSALEGGSELNAPVVDARCTRPAHESPRSGRVGARVADFSSRYVNGARGGLGRPRPRAQFYFRHSLINFNSAARATAAMLIPAQIKPRGAVSVDQSAWPAESFAQSRRTRARAARLEDVAAAVVGERRRGIEWRISVETLMCVGSRDFSMNILE